MMINLDDEEVISSINEMLGRDSKRGLRKLVRYEIKPHKFQNRILCLCNYGAFLISIQKDVKPYKIESFFHFLEIKKIESPNNQQLIITVQDNREFKLYPFEDGSCSGSANFESGGSDLDDTNSQDDNLSNDKLSIESSNFSVIDEILDCICKNLLDVFPSVTIKDLYEHVNIQPEKRVTQIYSEINETNELKKKLQLCGCYGKAYSVYCDVSSVNFYQEVVWDVNVIYGQNGLTEFSFNDFDYVNTKDAIPLILALRFNQWFEGISSENIKFSNEMQEELCRLLSLPQNNLKNITLIQSNLKYDFFQKLCSSFQSHKSLSSSSSNKPASFKLINLSRNSIEDKGVISLANLFKEMPHLCTDLSNLILSKCSISSKSVNVLFSNFSQSASSLTTLDLSNNFLKDEPVELFKFLSEQNSLIELNLSSTEIDLDKLFANLSKGGCDLNLKKLVISSNYGLSKLANNNECLVKYLSNAKSLVHLDISNCRLTGTIVQIILSTLKQNINLEESLHLNLSSNDLGSNVKSFMNEFNGHSCLTSIDLSDNNLDTDCELLIGQMSHSNIKSVVLSRNFQNSKSKHTIRIMNSLTRWAMSKTTSLQYLWLVDCKLKSSLNDFISEIGGFTQLRLLDITGNDIGDFGFNLLSKSLQVNRSLQTLIFDRSNVSLFGFNHIIDALKRNYTLKTIQMPINDICILYQKSPDKVVDIVKQMTEFFSQRNMLNAQNKCDLNQSFKTKMKLITDSTPTIINSNISNVINLNQNNKKLSTASDESLIESNEINNLLNLTNSSSNINNTNNFNTLSIKEILQCLNESANTYLNENSVDKNFSKFTDQILTKLDGFVFDLEKELVNTVKRKYPTYTANIDGTTNTNNKIDSSSDINKLKLNIKDYMNSMLIQIHNDICEMTYKLSTIMAEKIIYESQSRRTAPITQSLNSTKVINSVNNETSNVKLDTSSLDSNSTSSTQTTPAVPIPRKTITAGVKLPFPSLLNPPSDSSSNEPTSVQQRLELLNNSKTKRPISSQIYETSNNNGHDISNNSPPRENSKHSFGTSPNQKNIGSISLSNENITDNNISEEELESANFKRTDSPISNTSSREKTPDSLIEDIISSPKIGHHQTAINKSNAPPPVPIKPAPSQLSNSNSDEKQLSKSPKKDSLPLSTETIQPPPQPPQRNKAKTLVSKLFGVVANSKEPHHPPPPQLANKNNISNSQQQVITSPKQFNRTTSETSNDNFNDDLKENNQPAIESKSNLSIISNTSSLENDQQKAQPQQQALQHLNRDRPKRANVKKPTVKNPQSQIEVEAPIDDLNQVLPTVAITNSKTSKLGNISESSISENEQSSITITNGSSNNNKQPSPINPVNSIPTTPIVNNSTSSIQQNKPANTVEQPKISLNILENVKLRKTIRVKSPNPSNVEETNNTTSTNATPAPTAFLKPVNPPNTNTTPVLSVQNTSTSNTTINASTNFSSKLGNRLSMFEQSASTTSFPNIKLANQYKKTTEQSLIENETTNGNNSNNNDENLIETPQSVKPSTLLNKPLPPVPPNKPPRPAYNPALGKLASNSYTSIDQQNVNNNTNTQQPNILVKLRPVSSLNGAANKTESNTTNNITTTNTNTPLIVQNNLILNENNNPVGVTLSASTQNQLASASTTTLANTTNNNQKNTDGSTSPSKDKRSSVKEILQLFSEESKA